MDETFMDETLIECDRYYKNLVALRNLNVSVTIGSSDESLEVCSDKAFMLLI